MSLRTTRRLTISTAVVLGRTALGAKDVRYGRHRVGPGEVLHESPFASVVLAANNDAVVARVQRVADVLKRVGVDVEVAGNECRLP